MNVQQPTGSPSPEPKPQKRGVFATLRGVYDAIRNNWLLRRVGSVFEFCWRVVDLARRATVNGLFLAIVLLIVFVTCSSGVTRIKDDTVLVVGPRGVLVEELGGDPTSQLTDALYGGGVNEILLRDMLEALDHAKSDDRIDVVLLHFDRFVGGGMTKLEDVAAKIEELKAADKKVIAYADNYSQGAYYIAAHADEVYMHPMGMVGIEGFGSYGMYYKDAIDRLEIEWNVFRVGKFKSAVEPYLRSDMSPAAREARLAWMGDLWDAYIDGVAKARGVKRAELLRFANRFDEVLNEVDGDAAQAAVKYGLVDDAVPFDVVRKQLIESVGEDRKHESFRQVALAPYLEERRSEAPWDNPYRDTVAVVVARGTILDGEQGPGMIGGDSTSRLIRTARKDEHVKAIVLRVDSPGGSAFASELIRRELELAREAGKPVVVSMGSVAASGGYWISTASDKIYASPTTITGSIGIFGMFPTFERPLDTYLGIHTDGVATGPLAGVSPARRIDPAVARTIQRSIENGYQRFLKHVAKNRDMTVEQIDAIAQGRVWSGEDAHAKGLVDELGSLTDAVAAAAELAELDDDYRVHHVQPELDFADRLARNLMKRNAETLDQWSAETEDAPKGAQAAIMQLLDEQAQNLSAFNDPHGVYAYEMIEVD